MNKGVSDAQYKELLKKYGKDIGDKMFIMTISLHPAESYDESTPSQLGDGGTKLNPEDFSYQLGEVPEDFEVFLLDGSSISLAELKGKVVLINFWATWCAPCIMEFYDLKELILEPNKNKDFIFLAISIGESKERVQLMMEKLNEDGISFNPGLDPKKLVFSQFAKGSIPKSFLLDKEGVLRMFTEGNSQKEMKEIATTIEVLLN
jgi:thiol-disulfide isomerase/thioredoxin